MGTFDNPPKKEQGSEVTELFELTPEQKREFNDLVPGKDKVEFMLDGNTVNADIMSNNTGDETVMVLISGKTQGDSKYSMNISWKKVTYIEKA